MRCGEPFFGQEQWDGRHGRVRRRRTWRRRGACCVMLALAGVLAGVAASAQEPREPGAGRLTVERIRSGLLVAPDLKLTSIDGGSGAVAGLYGGFITDRRLLVGAGAYWLTGGPAGVDMAYGGGLVEWFANPDARVDFSVRSLFGFGRATLASTLHLTCLRRIPRPRGPSVSRRTRSRPTLGPFVSRGSWGSGQLRLAEFGHVPLPQRLPDCRPATLRSSERDRVAADRGWRGLSLHRARRLRRRAVAGIHDEYRPSVGSAIGTRQASRRLVPALATRRARLLHSHLEPAPADLPRGEANRSTPSCGRKGMASRSPEEQNRGPCRRPRCTRTSSAARQPVTRPKTATGRTDAGGAHRRLNET